MRKRPVDPRAGRRLAELRRLRRLTQPELAVMVGVTERTVRNYETARTALTLDAIQQFARALDCDEMLLITVWPMRQYARAS